MNIKIIQIYKYISNLITFLPPLTSIKKEFVNLNVVPDKPAVAGINHNADLYSSLFVFDFHELNLNIFEFFSLISCIKTIITDHTNHIANANNKFGIDIHTFLFAIYLPYFSQNNLFSTSQYDKFTIYLNEFIILLFVNFNKFLNIKLLIVRT